MKYFRTNRGWKVLFIGATAPWGRLIGQVGRGVITPGERQPGHLETDFDQLFFSVGTNICDEFSIFQLWEFKVIYTLELALYGQLKRLVLIY